MKRRLVMGAAVALVLVAFLVLGIRQWREYQFRSLTSIQHYHKAQELLYPRTQRPQEAQLILPPALRFSLPSEKALKEAIRHAEAITPEDPTGYQWAAEVLPYLRVARDRPQDLPYMLLSQQRARAAARAEREAKIRASTEADYAKTGHCAGLIDHRTGKCFYIGCNFGDYLDFRTDRRFEFLLAGIVQPLHLPDGFSSLSEQ